MKYPKKEYYVKEFLNAVDDKLREYHRGISRDTAIVYALEESFYMQSYSVIAGYYFYMFGNEAYEAFKDGVMHNNWLEDVLENMFFSLDLEDRKIYFKIANVLKYTK